MALVAQGMALMRCLITGATGLLGSYLVKTAPADAELYTQRFDILDRNAVYKSFDEAKPDVVIHCAGEGRVDFAESNRCAAWQANYEGTENVARAANHWHARLVYISSNAIYAGSEPPYNEGGIRAPINAYGETKASTEMMLEYAGQHAAIIRPILLYGWPNLGRGNFVTRCLEDLRDGVKVKVAEDIITQPTYARDCASAIWQITAQKKSGMEVVNIAPREKMSLFKFAVEIAKAFDYDPGLVIPVPSSEFKGLAPRPKDTTFDTRYMESKGITLRNPSEGLQAMRAERAA
jgi:dTDP-4-dehydrorhamnose reductase